ISKYLVSALGRAWGRPDAHFGRGHARRGGAHTRRLAPRVFDELEVLAPADIDESTDRLAATDVQTDFSCLAGTERLSRPDVGRHRNHHALETIADGDIPRSRAAQARIGRDRPGKIDDLSDILPPREHEIRLARMEARADAGARLAALADPH